MSKAKSVRHNLQNTCSFENNDFSRGPQWGALKQTIIHTDFDTQNT